MIVGYTKINAEGDLETLIHQECSTKAEAIKAADDLALASVDDETIIEVLRGSRFGDAVEYNVWIPIPRGEST